MSITTWLGNQLALQSLLQTHERAQLSGVTLPTDVLAVRNAVIAAESLLEQKSTGAFDNYYDENDEGIVIDPFERQLAEFAGEELLRPLLGAPAPVLALVLHPEHGYPLLRTWIDRSIRAWYEDPERRGFSNPFVGGISGRDISAAALQRLCTESIIVEADAVRKYVLCTDALQTSTQVVEGVFTGQAATLQQLYVLFRRDGDAARWAVEGLARSIGRKSVFDPVTGEQRQSPDGVTALVLAVRAGRGPSYLQKLMDLGADHGALSHEALRSFMRERYTRPQGMLANRRNDREIVRLLANAEPDVAVQDVELMFGILMDVVRADDIGPRRLEFLLSETPKNVGARVVTMQQGRLFLETALVHEQLYNSTQSSKLSILFSYAMFFGVTDVSWLPDVVQLIMDKRRTNYVDVLLWGVAERLPKHRNATQLWSKLWTAIISNADDTWQDELWIWCASLFVDLYPKTFARFFSTTRPASELDLAGITFERLFLHFAHHPVLETAPVYVKLYQLLFSESNSPQTTNRLEKRAHLLCAASFLSLDVYAMDFFIAYEQQQQSKASFGNFSVQLALSAEFLYAATYTARTFGFVDAFEDLDTFTFTDAQVFELQETLAAERTSAGFPQLASLAPSSSPFDNEFAKRFATIMLERWNLLSQNDSFVTGSELNALFAQHLAAFSKAEPYLFGRQDDQRQRKFMQFLLETQNFHVFSLVVKRLWPMPQGMLGNVVATAGYAGNWELVVDVLLTFPWSQDQYFAAGKEAGELILQSYASAGPFNEPDWTDDMEETRLQKLFAFAGLRP